MEQVIAWVTAHYKDIFAVIGSIVTTASLIVHITPTQKDDAFLEKIITILDKFSVIAKK